VGIVAGFLTNNFWFLLVSTGGIFVFICDLYFARDPERDIPDIEGIIVAPADGRIVELATNRRLPGVSQTYKHVAIFLSLWDVHANRVPVTGTVGKLTYQTGKFRPAFGRKASKENEHTIVPIHRNDGTFYVKQIAGVVARRIICDLKEGERVIAGQRMGRIVFGSRVELYLPDHLELVIRKGQKVFAGRSIIGKGLNEN